jgi:excisionase family DNA binding protein
VRSKEMADLLTTREIQELLHVDRTTVYRMVENGRLPAIRVGKQWRFARPEIERWLQTQSQSAALNSDVPIASNGNAPITSIAAPAIAPASMQGKSLRDLLPLGCVQLIQDAFADILGVMMVVTDMQGQPVTQFSNPCGLFTALTQKPDLLIACMRTWRELAVNPAIAPRFLPNEMGLLCARGLIRVESELKGMVVISGIAPDEWPPAPDVLRCLAERYGLNPALVQANAGAVYRLDHAAQERALHSVQRIADIFSHIAGDRNELCGRLQAIASLTAI